MTAALPHSLCNYLTNDHANCEQGASLDTWKANIFFDTLLINSKTCFISMTAQNMGINNGPLLSQKKKPSRLLYSSLCLILEVLKSVDKLVFYVF